MMKTSNLKKLEQGFSLVELLMVLIISSMFVTMIVVFYNQYNSQKRVQTTDSHMKESVLQLSMSFPATLSYPCPSNRALTATDPNYMREFNANCDVRGLVMGSGCTITASGGSLTTGVYNVNMCNGCTDDGGICVVPGARDLNESGTIGDDHREIVVIGGIPVRSMRNLTGSSFSDQIASDGYNSLLTYAVSRSLAHDAQYVYYQGVISAIDENGRPTAGINDDGHYAVISHGMNRQGAFSRDGVQIECGLLGRDTENCDADSTFMQAIMRNDVDGLAYYDDKITVARSTSLKLWTNIGNTSSVRNLNRNNLAINLPAPSGIPTTPSQLVHVGGDVRADGALRASQICLNPPGGDPDDTADDKCFDPGIFVSDNECSGPNTFVTHIDLGAPTMAGKLGCETMTFAPVVTRDCASLPGWVTAIRIDGTVECLADPTPDPPVITYIPLDDIVKPGEHTFSIEDIGSYTMFDPGGHSSEIGEFGGGKKGGFESFK